MQAFSKTEMVLISQIVLLINFNMLWATWRKIIHLSLTAENRARTKSETLANCIRFDSNFPDNDIKLKPYLDSLDSRNIFFLSSMLNIIIDSTGSYLFLNLF